MTTLLAILEDVVGAEYGVAAVPVVRGGEPAPDAREEHAPTTAYLTRFLRQLAESRKMPETKVYRWVGEATAPRVLRQLPNITRTHETLRSLLLRVNDLSEFGLQALVPDAEIPYFDVELRGIDSIRLIFSASENVGSLVEGLIVGSAKCYGEAAVVRTLPPDASRPNKRVCDITLIAERRTTPTTPSTPRNSTGTSRAR